MPLPTVTISRAELPAVDWQRYSRRYLNPDELEVLIHLLQSVAPKVVVEIGVNEGRTAKALLEYVPGIEHYIGVDVTPGYITAKAVQRREVPSNPGWLAADDYRFTTLISPRGSLDFSPSNFPLCDALFIDGDHGREAVLHDTAIARACVRPGGIIIWHDYHNLGTVDVRECLHQLRDQGANIQHVAGTWIAYERLP